jgi:hypothetical protein
MARSIIRVFAVAVLLLPLLALVVQARPLTRRAFVTAYPKTAGTRLDACVTCHSADGTSLNAYGSALAKSGAAFQPIERLDSDGDGVSNRLEIQALAFPGDAKDRPAAKRDSAAADSARRRPGPGALRPDSTARDSIGGRPDSLPPRPDSLPRPPARPDSGGARPDTLKPPNHG